MSIELGLLLAGVTTASEIVERSLKIVTSIRSGLGGGNNEVKRDLQDQLDKLRSSLAGIGVLAEAADAYLEALEEVRRLDVEALLLEQFLENSRHALQNHLDPTYEAAWQTAGQLLDVVDRNRGLALEVHLTRKRFFDRADDEMIGSRLNDVNEAYKGLVERLKARRYDDFHAGVASLRDPIRKVDALLHNTLTVKILTPLRQLQPAPSGTTTDQ
jgi:hypothetical protein